MRHHPIDWAIPLAFAFGGLLMAWIVGRWVTLYWVGLGYLGVFVFTRVISGRGP